MNNQVPFLIVFANEFGDETTHANTQGCLLAICEGVLYYTYDAKGLTRKTIGARYIQPHAGTSTKLILTQNASRNGNDNN